jgi:DNA polymerase-3 subunit alpha
MVWPRIYEADREIWQEGNAVVIEGKVRLRDDSLQLNCDHVRLYQPSSEPTPGIIDTTPVQESTIPVSTTTPTPAPPMPVSQNDKPDAPVVTSNGQKQHLVISLGISDDKDEDIARLHKIVDTLKEFSGNDEVSLCLGSNGSTTYAKLPNIGTAYGPELKRRLEELVGEDGVRVDPVIDKR